MSTLATDDLGQLATRVTTLERRARLATGAAAGAALIACLASGVALLALRRPMPVLPEPPTGPQHVEASEVVLRDPEGKLRGRWTAHGIVLADRTERMRAGLTVGDDGAPYLSLYSKEGSIRAVIGLGSGDTPGLTLHDDRGQVRTRIAVGADALPLLELSNPKNDVLVRLPPPAVKASRKGR